MNNGYTKVASFGTAFFEGISNRHSQVINDYRVAASLASRLDKILVKCEQNNPRLFFLT
jgi:hypothetical protein